MWFNKTETPISISAELDSKQFVRFIKNELKERHFDLVQYFTGYKYEPEDECNINKQCNDK